MQRRNALETAYKFSSRLLYMLLPQTPEISQDLTTLSKVHSHCVVFRGESISNCIYQWVFCFFTIVVVPFWLTFLHIAYLVSYY